MCSSARLAPPAPGSLEATIDGPQGTLGVPLLAERTIAVDPRFMPLGAPVYLATTMPLSTTPLTRLTLAQDTGGAIRGPVRADFFWGFGTQAGREAGRMKQDGRMWLLWPKGAPLPGVKRLRHHLRSRASRWPRAAHRQSLRAAALRLHAAGRTTRRPMPTRAPLRRGSYRVRHRPAGAAELAIRRLPFVCGSSEAQVQRMRRDERVARAERLARTPTTGRRQPTQPCPRAPD